MPCGSLATCLDRSKAAPWDGHSHCGQCVVACPPPSSPPPAPPPAPPSMRDGSEAHRFIHGGCARCALKNDTPREEEGRGNLSSAATGTKPAARTPLEPPSFCEGLGTDMHMSGFVWGTSECLNFLLIGWRLDSPLKYFLVRAASCGPASPARPAPPCTPLHAWHASAPPLPALRRLACSPPPD